MEENKDDLRFYPGYWIYNAGLVGMIRTFEHFGKHEGLGYSFENNSLIIYHKYWPELKRYYVEYMEDVFGKNWFYWKIAGYKGTGIFSNNRLINGLEKEIKEYDFFLNLNDEDWLYSSDFPISKWRFFQWIIFSISKIDKKEIAKDIEPETLKEAIKNRFKELKKGDVKELDFENELYQWKDEEKKKIIKAILNYLALKKTDAWEQLWDKNEKVKKDVLDILNTALIARIENSDSKIKKERTCSFCSKATHSKEFFETKWFSYEGGSMKFNNFYYNNSTQLPLCANCQLVIYFSPLGIFPDSDTGKGEFINIPDARYLWELNNYRMKVYNINGNEESVYTERNKLIDSIVSTGAYLQLKSRWLLQNIEIISMLEKVDKKLDKKEKRKTTVYNFEMSPRVLNLLGDYSVRFFPQWLNQIESINVQSINEKPGVRDNKHWILTKKYTEFTKGREIIERVLRNDTGWLNKISILLFKLYFEIEKNSNSRLNDFDQLIEKSIKPLLLVTLSLIRGKESFSEIYELGKSIGGLFKSAEEKAKFEKTILSPLFNCIYTLRKSNFVEIVMRIYMEYECKVDGRLIDILKFKDIEFQVESLLLLIGILERINKGAKDE